MQSFLLSCFCFLFFSALAQSPKQGLPSERTYKLSLEQAPFDTAAFVKSLAATVLDSLRSDLSLLDSKETPEKLKHYNNLFLMAHAAGHDVDTARQWLNLARQNSAKEIHRQLLGYDWEILMRTIGLTQRNPTQFSVVYLDLLSKTLTEKPVNIAESALNEITEGWACKDRYFDFVFRAFAKNNTPIPESAAIALVYAYLQDKYCSQYGRAILAAHEDWKQKYLKKTTGDSAFWQKRSATMPFNQPVHPLVIAVWDSGVDMAVLPTSQRWQNRLESKDGTDNDNNGYIDDLHGIGFDYQGNHDTILLKVPIVDSTLYKEANRLSGLPDMPDDLRKKHLESKKRHEQMLQLVSKLARKNYIHGTHVAGIAAENNPAVRIMSIRYMSSRDKTTPPRTNNRAKIDPIQTVIEQHFYKQTITLKKIGDYIRQGNARVVNMSWISPSKSELSMAFSMLNNNSQSKLSKDTISYVLTKGLDSLRNTIRSCITGASNTLFIAAAGNSNEDPYFNERFPAGFDLPNLLVVGAVDNYGKITSFSNIGPGVKVYANGYEVESFVPGGAREKHSGTSMAAPQAANLAGKILALQPQLSPSEVIDLIIRHSDRMEENILVINPKKTLEALR
jgi:Subtilase family